MGKSKKKKKLSPDDFLSLDEEFIVLAAPTDTVEVDIEAKIYHDGELFKVSRHMDFNEVRQAFAEAKTGYIPSDTLFSLAPVGEEKMLDLVRRYREGLDD